MRFGCPGEARQELTVKATPVKCVSEAGAQFIYFCGKILRTAGIQAEMTAVYSFFTLSGEIKGGFSDGASGAVPQMAASEF